MSLETPRDLFLHELSDTVSAEHIVLGMLSELESESANDDVRAAVKHHQAETKDQIKNLEKVFRLLGEKPEDTTCHAAEGLKKEHDSLKEENPSPLVLEVGNLAGAAKTEHYEIASYTLLIQMAKDLGEQDVAELLKENLDQEKEMARKVESLARLVGKDVRKEMKELDAVEA
ncbi:MAG: ferritin-like domain-containing protein [Thermomicrobiales bacterium]